MPKGDPSVTTVDRCYYCNERVGKSNLKKCSKCQFVRYCSHACQKAAWPMHKHACDMATTFYQDPAEHGMAGYIDAFNKWLDCWRGTIFAQGIYALDLANHPPDRLATHVVFILVARNEPAPAERERYFKVIGAEVLSREERAVALRDLGVSQRQVDELDRDERGDYTIQVTLVAEGHTRMLWCSYRNLAKYRDIDKGMSAGLAAEWQQVFIEQVASGYPGLHNDIAAPEDE
ncbi:zinc finger MYND domain-containing protein [Phanerochaete sordida]|uniref:Zinc finger MYND domain-containing protein n=1 Tax=Phanerochaete sordida TaxID=48140 RepID=A0A9P3GCQ7_9APHY|nr:zinc finger MYND domain-containing protein [Phanerochaete sordida]